MATGTIKKPVSYIDYDSPAATISAGTIGTFATDVTVDVTVQGKTPISAMLVKHQQPGSANIVPVLIGNTLHLVFYRCGTAAGTIAAKSAAVRIAYI